MYVPLGFGVGLDKFIVIAWEKGGEGCYRSIGLKTKKKPRGKVNIDSQNRGGRGWDCKVYSPPSLPQTNTTVGPVFHMYRRKGSKQSPKKKK